MQECSTISTKKLRSVRNYQRQRDEDEEKETGIKQHTEVHNIKDRR
jgi:hypothetical protein